MSLDVHLYEWDEEVYWANITHNLNTMAAEAGIYKALWRPEEIEAHQAKEIIELLQIGLKRLQDNPEYFKKFNASNEWGTYKDFVPFVDRYLAACEENPEAYIVVSR